MVPIGSWLRNLCNHCKCNLCGPAATGSKGHISMGEQQYQNLPVDQANVFNKQLTTQTNQSKQEVRTLLPNGLNQNQNQFWLNANQQNHFQNQNYSIEQTIATPYQYQAQQTTTSHQATVTSQQQTCQIHPPQQTAFQQQPHQQVPNKAEVEVQTDIRRFFALQLPTVPLGTRIDTQHIRIAFTRDMMSFYGQGQVKVQGNTMYVYY